jgi:hypothetical protein
MYRGLKKITPGAELVPVCYAWDIALKSSPNLVLWEDDGNHASALGTYLASNVFYYYIAGLKGTPTWTLAGVPPATAHLFRASAKRAVAEHPNK